jgi:hypothetical protein
MPFCLTLLSVAWAEAPVAKRLAASPTATDAMTRFMKSVLPVVVAGGRSRSGAQALPGITCDVAGAVKQQRPMERP